MSSLLHSKEVVYVVMAEEEQEPMGAMQWPWQPTGFALCLITDVYCGSAYETLVCRTMERFIAQYEVREREDTKRKKIIGSPRFGTCCNTQICEAQPGSPPATARSVHSGSWHRV